MNIFGKALMPLAIFVPDPHAKPGWGWGLEGTEDGGRTDLNTTIAKTFGIYSIKIYSLAKLPM